MSNIFTMFNAEELTGFKVESGDFSLALGLMPLATVQYLLANGFSQSLTDARTTASAKALATAVADWAKANGREPTVAERAALKADQSAAMESAGLAAMAKRMDSLRDGTMVYGARGPNGPRKSPEEAYYYSRAEADGKATLTKKGIAHPKGREELDAMVAKVLSVRGAAYKKDWEKQQALTGGLDDLF